MPADSDEFPKVVTTVSVERIELLQWVHRAPNLFDRMQSEARSDPVSSSSDCARRSHATRGMQHCHWATVGVVSAPAGYTSAGDITHASPG